MPTGEHDAVLLDLDGVVYAGDEAVPGAPEALARLREDGTVLRFVTNNASRTPEQVADKLVGVGVHATSEEVLGSARAAVELLVGRFGLADGDAVAVVGGNGLLVAVTQHGLLPVPVVDVVDRPAAVVQGFSPDLTWADLAAATYWVREGVPWVATNLDLTIPTGRGIAPGNGLLVRTVAEASGREPVAVAGKPEPHLFASAARSAASTSPLVVGDRLDTDIAGGRAAGFETALVLTGVHGTVDALAAAPSHRPDRVLGTLADLWDSPGRATADRLTELLHEGWRALDALDADGSGDGSGDGSTAGAAGGAAADERRRAVLADWTSRLSPAAR